MKRRYTLKVTIEDKSRDDKDTHVLYDVSVDTRSLEYPYLAEFINRMEQYSRWTADDQTKG